LWIVDFKGLAHEIVLEIQFRSINIKHRHIVNEHRRAIALKHQVLGISRGHQVELILEP
jgi:hypothetical protein